MPVFLAPLPVLHVASMFEDIKHGNTQFAFGSNYIGTDSPLGDEPWYDSDDSSKDAYLYVSSTGAMPDKAFSRYIGQVRIRAVFKGWTRAGRRGDYPSAGLAHRPTLTKSDSEFFWFWEIGCVTMLDEPIAITSFCNLANGKPFAENFIPRHPSLAELSSQ
jgi:hypothetical protein